MCAVRKLEYARRTPWFIHGYGWYTYSHMICTTLGECQVLIEEAEWKIYFSDSHYLIPQLDHRVGWIFRSDDFCANNDRRQTKPIALPLAAHMHEETTGYIGKINAWGHGPKAWKWGQRKFCAQYSVEQNTASVGQKSAVMPPAPPPSLTCVCRV